MHKSQVFLYLLSSFILGVFFSSLWSISDSVIFILTIIGVAIITLSFKSRLGLLIGFLILAFAVGGARFSIFNNSSTDLEDLVGQEVVLLGHVDNEPEI